MFKTIVNKLLMSLYFIVGTLILELVTFKMLNMGGAVPDYFLFNFALILCVAFFVFIIPNYKAQYIIYTVILTIQTAFIYVNYSLLTIYGDLFSFEMFRLIDEAGAAVTGSFVYLPIILQLVGVYLAVTILGSFLLKYCRKDKIDMKVHFSIFNVVIILSLQLISLGYYFNIRTGILNADTIVGQDYTNNTKLLMQTSMLKSKSYKTFGTYGYFSNLIINAFNETNMSMQDLSTVYFESGKTYGQGDNHGELFGVDKGNNVIVIMMESTEWFGFGDGTYDRDLNNLSYELTPNIYALMYGEDYKIDKNNVNKNNDGVIAKNGFAKSKTNISEAIGIMGNYPIGKDLISLVGKQDLGKNTPLAYAMPYVLREKGYTTTYVHSNRLGYYGRNRTHKNFGFDSLIGPEQLIDSNGNKVYTNEEMQWDNWDAEGDFARNAINHIIPTNCKTKPFYTFYLNVSSHGSYLEVNNRKDGDALRYMDYIKYGPDDCRYNAYTGEWKLVEDGHITETEWYSNVKKNYNSSYTVNQMLYYQCGMCGLDEAIGVIVNKLKDYGIKDKTTLLLYSDHYAYYNELSNRVKNLPLDDRMSVEVNSIPLIISSPGIKKYNAQTSNKYTVYDRFCSSYDIVPTLFDLLGVKYNENLYLGQTMFHDTDYQYYYNGQWYDMTIYYSHTGGIFSRHITTSDFTEYTCDPGIGKKQIEVFDTAANAMLAKLNYLGILNDEGLWHKLENK